MQYDTAFRPYLRRRIEQIETADILIGIPCYNNESTIGNVIKQISKGLAMHYKSARSVILVSDGGSTDDTREVAQNQEIMPWQEKIIFIYRGVGGKGTALRAIFEAAENLNVRACAVVDSDLRSITPDWVRYLVEPVLEKGYQFVAPVYSRYKYDGTITNNVVYCVTRALYGRRIRQPIGGDFAFSRDTVECYLRQNVWMTDVARFGIDIWMTTNAITNGFRICQANLGAKVHDPKDPGSSLGPMFRQVVVTLFTLMEQYSDIWKKTQGSEPVETFGLEGLVEPEPVGVNLDLLVYNYKVGFQHFGILWKEILSPPCFDVLRRLAEGEGKGFLLSASVWSKIIYEMAATFHHWPKNRVKLVDIMSPLYNARVASFINQTGDMSSAESEKVVEEQAEVFEREKDYLKRVWDRDEGEPADKSLFQKVLSSWRT